MHPPIQCVLSFFPVGKKGRGVKLINHLHLVSRLGMTVAIRPFPLFALTAWKATALPFF
jgi:hypothetical protein